MAYLLLMRHAAHEGGSDAKGMRCRKLTADAEAQITEVARALDEFIDETKDLPKVALTLAEIWHATSDEATQTAAILHKHLARCDADPKLKKQPEEHLSPRKTSPYGPAGNYEPVVEDIRNFFSKAPSDSALIVIGHQPLLGWIAEAFAREAYPIGKAELLCLYSSDGFRRRNWWELHILRRRAVLLWVLTPGDSSGVINELKEKVRGKWKERSSLARFPQAS